MPDILVPKGDVPTIGGARIHERDAQTYRILRSHAEAGPGDIWGCLMLDPVYAIADAWLDRDRGGSTHVYDPDDIEPDCMDFLARLRKSLADLLAGDRQIEECIQHFSAAIEHNRPGWS
ncbi:hypothetical protein [Paracoccus sp. ME4]|uniref:hypothetical protein n=1 Tax=Paracoccus sp. ME4 TaxID=3138066 RepID=UPI00398A7C85